LKPLIIGEAPGKSWDPNRPLEGRTGARLAACAGISFEEFLTTFDRVNLLDEQPQDAAGGMTFNMKQAARVARVMEQRFGIGQVVLLLGKRVASAFRLTSVAYFETFALNHARVTVVPHPSGANRWWNDPENEKRMHDFMQRLMTTL
jgi:uracil-DNA glycosylase